MNTPRTHFADNDTLAYIAKIETELAAAHERIRALEGDAGRCICKGNWQSIIGAYESRLDGWYADEQGNKYQFFGVVWASDDLYYGMRNCETGNVTLLSCVGDIEGFGYTNLDASIAKEAERG